MQAPNAKILAAIFLLLAVAGGLVAWVARKPAARGDKVTICTPGFQSSALLLVAQEKKMFREEGLDVELVYRPMGKDCLELMLQGKVNFAAVFETPVVHATLKGHRLGILTELHSSEENTGIVYRTDRKIKKARDLMGKRIGVVADTTGEYLTQLFLRSHMISFQNVGIRKLTVEKLVESLKKGTIDAAGLWEPEITKLRTELPDLFQKISFPFYTEFCVLVTSRKPAAVDRQNSAAVVRALVRAQEYYQGDISGSQKIVDDLLRARGFAVYEESWPRFNVHLGLSATLLTTLNEEANWYQSRNRGERLDMNVLFEARFLRELSPLQVTFQ